MAFMRPKPIRAAFVSGSVYAIVLLGLAASKLPAQEPDFKLNNSQATGKFDAAGTWLGRSGATKEVLIREGGGTKESEAAVANGLKWLARQQLPDGKWSLNSPNLPAKDRGTALNESDIAGTAFGLLPFLAAGKTHIASKNNPYDKNVGKGLAYLMRIQNQKTGFYGNAMYAHGLATIAMCEAYGLTQDPKLRRSAQMAINLIINAQHEQGGWRYAPKQPGDLSVTGFQIVALKSAQMAGLDVPKATLKKAIAFLDKCSNPDGGYGYIDTTKTLRMTAVGILARQYLQKWGPTNPMVVKATDYLKTNPPDRADVYFYYYATQVMYHIGGDAWKDWNEKMRESLIKKQDVDVKSPSFGSWSPQGDEWGRVGGRLMMTSMNLLTLEIYYRYVPLFPREPVKKEIELPKLPF